jgi:hypothetical protein
MGHQGRAIGPDTERTGHQVLVETHDPVPPERVDLTQQGLHRPVVLQPRVSGRPALMIAGLHRDAGPGVGLAETAPIGEARDAQIVVNTDDHREVIGSGHVQLDEQRNLVDDDGPRRRRVHQRTGAGTDQRVGDGLQILARPSVGKDNLAQRRAVQRTIGRDHLVTEAPTNRAQTGRAACDDLACQLVRVDHHGSQIAESPRHGRLSGADPTGQSYAEHAPTLARSDLISRCSGTHEGPDHRARAFLSPRRQVTSAAYLMVFSCR